MESLWINIIEYLLLIQLKKKYLFLKLIKIKLLVKLEQLM